MELLTTVKAVAEEGPMKIVGDPSQLVSGGHCGRREIQNVLKSKIPNQKIKIQCVSLL